MRKIVLSVLLCLGIVFAFNTSGNAQTKVIHFWNFNNYSGTVHLPAFMNVAPSYTTIDTVHARWIFQPQPGGVSSGYLGYSDNSAPATADYDTINQAPLGVSLGVPSGTSAGNNFFRARNPNDSMWLLVYMPTTHYQNITIKYGTETSSTSSGDSAQIYSYSLDSGVTWNTVGLSVQSLVLGTPYLQFAPAQVTITDPAANNNPKLVFRITFKGRNTGTSGNNRFDNFAVMGDTILPSGNLVHFWDFNTYSSIIGYGLYPVCGSTIVPFPNINPDYTIHPTANAYVTMRLMQGAALDAATNPVYLDEVSTVAGDADTVNQNWTALGGTVAGGYALRPRNPLDSSYLVYYMPTANYKNIVLTYGSESSSYTSGDSIQTFNYSVDSGVTWRLAGISEAYDSASLAFRRIQVKFTDPAANNCPTLFFRIGFSGRTLSGSPCPTGYSGNNRFDNISVQGDSIISPSATITTTPAAYGPLCNTASNSINVAFTTTGALGQTYSVQITNSVGVFPTNTTSNIIGTGTTSPITAIVPAGTTAGTLYRVRVVSSYPGIYGSDNGSNIVLNGVAGPITGNTTVCASGGLDTLTESGAGTWSSSNTSKATIGSATGIVTGGATPGIDTIVFTIGPGCTASATITVNPVPLPITGLFNECVGVGTTLNDATPLGTWSSSALGVATIGSGSGAVTPITVGNTNITYTLPTTGCYITHQVTVNPLPSAITGLANACVGLSTTLADAGGGSWSSSNNALATVGTSGTVSGVAGGTPTITYTLPTGCIATVLYTVNPNPAAITGPSTGCVGATSAFSDSTAFGAWSSSSLAVATIGSATGVATGIGTGTTTISYTLSTGCQTTKSLTINAASAAITGTFVICAGSNTTLGNSSPGGTWSCSDVAVATIGSSSGTVTGIVASTPTITYTLPTGCIATKTITINPLPASITGQSSLYCLPSSTTLADITPGGTWSSGTPAVATIGSGSGLVTGVAAGTTTITYTLPTGCKATLIETVYPTPAPITGNTNACVGATTNYTDVTAFGAWSSSNTSIATIGSGTGIATGVATGVDTILYTVSTGCVISKSITVNPVPLPITGSTQVCATGSGAASTVTLSDPTPLGSWSSSIPALANIDAVSGVVTGIAAGNPTITYMLPTGCIATTAFTVNPLPAPIGGLTSVYCIGSTALLSDFITGGTWSSSNPAIATIDGTGLVTGVAAGSATITYTLPTACYTTYVENITSTPAPITGDSTTCVSTNVTLSDVTAFGAWSSSTPSVATIGSGTGIVTGVGSGTTVITYELSPSCLITQNVTVNPQPSAISGTTNVCIGSNTTLTDAGGGTWTSSIPALATVGAATGVVSGIVAGTVVISYTLPTGCVTSTNFTVNPLPVISGATTICLGLPSPLNGNIPGGAWSSSTTSVATIGSSSGILSGVSLGTTVITYTLPTGCMTTTTVTVNPPPASITGTSHVCVGSTTALSDIGGGGWYSSNPSIAPVGFGTGIVTGLAYGTAVITYSLGTSCISTTTVTVDSLPSAITGTAIVCQGSTTTLNDATATGTWSSSNPAQATVGTLSGIVTGVSGGSPRITYTVTGTGCIATATVIVNPIAPITGTTNVCTGLTTTLHDSLSAGTWTSGTTSVATVGSASGIVSGIAAGATVITYTLPTGCMTSTALTVNATPAAVIGNDNVCLGTTNPFTDATPGGTWSSSNPFVATIGPSTGLVTGSTLGSSIIFYTLSTGCSSATLVTVDPLPVAIIGAANVCAGNTTTLIDSTAGGSWSSSSTAFATIGAFTGVVTGVASGSPMITYMLPTGCIATTSITVRPLPTIHAVTGGGSYCASGPGLHIGLDGSDSGISYQLYLGSSTVGSAVAGTGSALDFGLHTAAGVYTAVATNTTTTCTDIMSGSETITIIALPDVYNVTGGGGYCAGGAGVNVGLSNSDSGINYQLYNIPTAVGSPLAGTGSALSYGAFTTAGHYMVIATNPLTTCTRNMHDTVTIFLDTLFTPTITITVKPTGQLQVGQYDTLTAHVSNGGGSISYQWVNNVTYIAGATTSTYISNAFYDLDSISVIVSDSTTCGKTINPQNIVLRIHDVAVQPVNFVGGNLTLIPNPNKGIFTIKGSLGSTVDEEVSLEITDMLGQVIYKQNAKAPNGELNEQILLNNSLANGMYILNVRSGSENKVFHFVMEK